VPSHHDHRIGEWIGIRAEVDHVVTFNRTCPVNGNQLCQMPCRVRPAPVVRAAGSGVLPQEVDR